MLSRYDNLPVNIVTIPVEALPQHTGMEPLLLELSLYGAAPMVDETGHLVALVRDRDVLNHDASAHGPSLYEVLSAKQSVARAPALPPKADIAEARRLFSETGLPLLPVLDEDGRYSGECVSREKLFVLLGGQARPPRIGGLATPLGVYMTSGRYASGAGLPGLLVTGVLFALLLSGLEWGYMIFLALLQFVWPDAMYLAGMPTALLQLGFILTAIMGIIRLTPMAGLHAAEHMTINAIERGLPLRPEAVRTQPRQHVRCGTNLMVLIFGIQIAWMSLEFIRPYLSPLGAGLYMLFWLLVIFSFWHRVGHWVQTWFTTRPPTDRQLASGIRAGEELLARYRAAPHPEPGLLWRLWGMGIIQMAGAFFLTVMLVDFLFRLLPDSLLARLIALALG